ncbi:DUF397 domain-containing protein [Streptomyces atratus]|uniref:DUF397 domain-containing protein n=1 Tax=Streptomyces atratus TaxID=1893 RepID=A0A1K2F6W6_STRAR|nr:DUF397 domain-containing protein [Streptomyces atratus]SFY43475.1 protein of unknown function [Streptomyces atratus]
MRSINHTVTDARALTGWFKSSYSGGSNGDCLEAARGYTTVPVRDSKAPSGPAVVFSPVGWSSFVEAIKDGRLSA